MPRPQTKATSGPPHTRGAPSVLPRSQGSPSPPGHTGPGPGAAARGRLCKGPSSAGREGNFPKLSLPRLQVCFLSCLSCFQTGRGTAEGGQQGDDGAGHGWRTEVSMHQQAEPGGVRPSRLKPGGRFPGAGWKGLGAGDPSRRGCSSGSTGLELGGSPQLSPQPRGRVPRHKAHLAAPKFVSLRAPAPTPTRAGAGAPGAGRGPSPC